MHSRTTVIMYCTPRLLTRRNSSPSHPRVALACVRYPFWNCVLLVILHEKISCPATLIPDRVVAAVAPTNTSASCLRIFLSFAHMQMRTGSIHFNGQDRDNSKIKDKIANKSYIDIDLTLLVLIELKQSDPIRKFKHITLTYIH